jgi:hypothetical protein
MGGRELRWRMRRPQDISTLSCYGSAFVIAQTEPVSETGLVCDLDDNLPRGKEVTRRW